MKNLNLLPKIPKSKRIFLPTLLIFITVMVVMSSGIWYGRVLLSSNITQTQLKITEAETAVRHLTAQREQDAMTRDYMNLFAQVKQLRASRVSWSPVLTLITSNLPKEARMLSASIPKDDGGAASAGASSSSAPVVQLSLEFAGLSQAAEYVLLLQRSDLIQSVAIQSAVKTEKIFTPLVADTSKATNEASKAGGQSNLTVEEIEKQLESKIPEATTEAEELLNQLEWTIKQEMVSQRFGFKLPDKNFTGTSIDESQLPGPLTKEDILQAKQELESSLKPEVLGNNTFPDTPDTIEPGSKLHIYQVSVKIQLKTT
jgi:hypothetical protein